MSADQFDCPDDRDTCRHRMYTRCPSCRTEHYGPAVTL